MASARSLLTFTKCDSVPQGIIGNWYLSGTSFYESEYTEGNEFYVAADDSLHLKITKDSIFFISPPSRFYHSLGKGYKYDLGYDSLFRQMELFAYQQHRKKKFNLKRFVIESDKSELRLKEELFSEGYVELHISSCQIYRPTFDSTHLDKKLLGSWQTDYEWQESDIKPTDTIVLYKTDEQTHLFGGLRLTIELKKGTFTGTMERSYRITHKDVDQESPAQGIVDGVHLFTLGKCSTDPISRTMIIQSEYEKYLFSILSVNEDQLTLIHLEKTQIKPYRLNYRN